MQRESPRQRAGTGVPTFETKLEKEEEILEGLIARLGRGQLPSETWGRLHEAAQRDGRLAELAFAYESVAQGKRLRALAGGAVAELNYQAAIFFGDVFGDEFGAMTYLDRALEAAPTHHGAFEKLAALLTKTQSWRRLGELYANIAQHRPRAEQADLLRVAADLFDRTGGLEEKAIELYQQLVRLDPHDAAARAALEARYLRANRVRDVVRLLEQALMTDPPPAEVYERRVRARLIELYATQLHEPERSMPHVEALLALDPAHGDAQRVAGKLLVIKGLAARAAAALSAAHERLGNDAEVARLLTIELEHTRGPKRRDVLRRLGILRQDRLGDPTGAYETFEAALGMDPSDDGLRKRYADAAAVLGRQLDAARTLSRVGMMVKDTALRTRLSSEMGELLLAGGDAKKARATFVSVMAASEADDAASLGAARALTAIYEAEKDHKALAHVLERISRVDPDPAQRRATNERLAELYSGVLQEPAKAIAAWQRLVETPSRFRALASLELLYETTGGWAELASVLEERAKDTKAPVEARSLLVRAAEVLTEIGEGARASGAWRRIVEKFGAARDVHARWLPILEAQKQWSELASALAAEAQLAPEIERPALYARLGAVAQARLRDVPAALDAFRRALTLDPTEKTARAAVEKLLAAGEHRLAAAAVLEPIYRKEGAAGPLLRVLDARASLGATPGERMEALDEAVRVSEANAAEASRALELAGRGLVEAAIAGASLRPWLDAVERCGAQRATGGGEPKRVAGILDKALGERAVGSEDMLVLARLAGEALSASGDIARALDAFRRALAYDPSSSDIVARVDQLLREQGSPHDRVALYRAAVEREVDPRKKIALHHTIASIERRELVDKKAAIATYKRIVESDPDDRDAHLALVELFSEYSSWSELCDELERHLGRTSGEEAQVARTHVAEVAASHGQIDRARAHARALLGEETLTASFLDAIAKVADRIDDVDLACDVLRRRARDSEEPHEEVGWLETLGVVQLEQRHDPVAAAATWRVAARAAADAADEDLARRMYERVRTVAPADHEAAERLSQILEAAEDFAKLPEILGVLLAHASDDAMRVEVLMRLARVHERNLDDVRAGTAAAARAFEIAPHDRHVLETFERLATAAGALGLFAAAVDGIASGSGDGIDPALRVDLALARARALANDPAHAASAASSYRALLEDQGIDEERRRAAAADFDALLLAAPAAPEWTAHRRWLFAWHAEHLPEAERLTALVTWATAEEEAFAEPARALDLQRRILEIDPDSGLTMAAIARLSLATGDVSGAIDALALRRDRSEGAARNALDLEIATILLDRSERSGSLDQALACVAAVLESAPHDAAARELAARALAIPEGHTRAVELLERSLDATEDETVRTQILAHLLGAPPASPAEATRRRDWYERLLDLYEVQASRDLALELALRAVEELPSVESLWDRAEGLARERERPDDVARLYQKAMGGTLARDEALALGQRAVAFFEEWFEDSAGVVRILERVLEIDPAASWAFERLKLLFNAAEQWDALFVLYDRALASATGPSRIELLEDAAQVAKDFAGNAERAILYLEQLHVLKPSDARLTASLERLYERHNRHRELIALLTAQLPSLTGAAAHRARVRIATLWLNDLSDAASALVAVEDMIAHAGKGDGRAGGEGGEGDDANVDAEISKLLERIVTKAPALAEVRDSVPGGGAGPSAEGAASSERGRRESQPPFPSAPKRPLVRQRAAGLLRDRYAEPGRETDLARVLEIELEAVKNVKERIRRHLQVAQIHARLGNDGAALEHYTALVLLEPDVEDHRLRLAEIAARTGNEARYAEVLASAAEDCAADTLRVELLMQAGAVHADILKDGARAIELFLRVVAIGSLPEGEPATVLAAARRVEPLLLAAGRSLERLEVLERMAPLEAAPERRTPLLHAAAKLAADLGEADRAILAWEAVLRETPTDIEALDGLVAVLEKESRFAPLVEALALRAKAPVPEAWRRRDRVRIAQVLQGELGAPERAVEAWRDVEREFGEGEESSEALAELLRAGGRFDELARVLARAAARADVPSRTAHYLERLGDVQRLELGARGDAASTYEDALSADPTNVGARAGMHALLDDPAQRGRAADVLTRVYAATESFRAALDLTEHRLATAPHDAAKIAILRETAALAETRAGDLEIAFDATRRAFLLASGDEAVEATLARLADATAHHRAYADALSEAIDAREATLPRDVALIVRLRTHKADVTERHLDDPRTALTSYLRVVADVPAQVDTARAAIRVAARVGRWESAAKVIVDHARAVGKADPELLGLIEEGARSPHAWDNITSALATALADHGDMPAAAVRDLEARLGAWHRDKREDQDAAEAAYARALAADPESAELLTALADLQRRTKGRPLIDSLLRLSQATGGDLGLLREAAEIAVSPAPAGGDRTLARSILEKLLKLGSDRWAGVDDDGPPTLGSPMSPAPIVEWALGELVRLHEEEGEGGRLVDLLVDAARLPFDRDVARRMRHEAARVALERAADPDRAAALYLALFEEDAQDEPAVSRLVAIYESQKQAYPLLALRRRQVARAKTPDARVVLRRAVAKLLFELEDVERAVATLHENLAEEPRDAETVDELARILDSLGRAAALQELYAAQAELAEAADDKGAAADLWTRAAGVAEERCGDPAAAVVFHGRVIALEPRAASLDALARLSSLRGDFDAAARYLGDLVAVADGPARSQVALRLATALEKAGRADLAREQLEAEAERAPQAEEVWTRLAAMYREREDYLRLARLLARAATQAPDKATRLARLREAADLYRTRCDSPESAVPLLEQAADLEPESQATRLRLADVLSEAGRFEEARSHLRALIDGYGARRPKERAPVHYHLAKLELAMGDRARALVELDVATRIDPANPEILLSLAELSRDDGQLDRAERSYRALLVVLRRHDARDEAAAPPPVARSQVLLELCAIAERQGEAERAAELLESALEAAGRGASEAFELERALRERGRFADMAARYVDVLAGLAREAHARGEPERESELLVRVASVLETDLGDDARAAAVYEEALARGIAAAEILRRLDRAYERTNDAEAQARILAKRIDLANETRDTAGAAHALFRLATLRFRDARTASDGCDLVAQALDASLDYDRAEEALRLAVATAPANERVLALYERVGRQEGRERALLDALTRRIALPETAGGVLREAVELATRLGDPAHAEGLLRRFLDQAREAGGDDDRAWAQDTLAGLRLAAGDVREAVALKNLAAEISSPAAARQLKFQIAKLAATTLDDLALAASTYESLLARDPSDREAWGPLLDVYRRMGDGKRLVALLGAVVDHVDEASERSRLRFERVRVMMRDLGMGDAAAEPLREIVDEDPSQVEAAILLAGILERRGAHEDLADLLRKQLDSAKDRGDAASVASLALRLGVLLERRDRDDARSVYAGALEWEPQNRELLRALFALSGETSDGTERADVMERLLALETGEEAEKLALALSALRAEMWDDAGAERALESGYKAHPASRTLRERLEATYRERGSWTQLAELHTLHARACDDPAERVDRFREAARIYRHELRERDGGALVLREALEGRPGDATLLGELVELLAEGGDLRAAEEELTRALGRIDDADASRGRLLAQRAELRAKLGDNDGDSALADFDAAFAVGAVEVNAVLAHLARMRDATVARGDGARARGLALRMAELYPLTSDVERARGLLSDLVKADAKDREALRALARLEERAERWDAASATYRRLVALEEGEAVVETALRLADACERAHRFADARGGLERARLVAPGDDALRARLERLYEATGAYRELAEMQLADAKAARDVAGRFAALVRAGAILLEHGTDRSSAAPPLREAHALRPADLECTALLADALTAAGLAGEALELLSAAVASHKGRRSKELAPLYHRLARASRASGERAAEMAWLSTALDMDAQNGTIASELASVALDLQQLDVAQRALRAITMLRGTAPISKALAYQRMGEIARQQGDTKRAALLLKRAVDDDPTLDSARALLAALEVD